MTTNYRLDAIKRYNIQLPFSPSTTMSVQQVAGILDCGVGLVRKLCRQRRLKYYAVRPAPNAAYRIYKESVAQFLQELSEKYDLRDLDSANPARLASHSKLVRQMRT